MRKKYIALLLLAVSLLLLCSCKHKHTYSGWDVIVEATCEKTGFITRTCSDCGHAENQTVAALGHNEEIIAGKESSCTEEGLSEGAKCLRCGKITAEQQLLPKIEHSIVTTPAKEATCVLDGCSEGRACSLCGQVFSQATVIPKLGHTIKTTAGKNATCTSEGISDGKQCTVCNMVLAEQKTLPALGHKYSSKITKAATCTSNGTKTFTCSNCGKSYTETLSLSKYEASALYEKVEKSVGEIVVFDANGSEFGLGTCFVISADGKVVTNFHVIDDAFSAKVTMDGKTYNVSSVLAYDMNKDLAVLKLEGTGFSPLNLCTLTHPTGATVYALGSSLGLTATFTKGIITHEDRIMDGVHCIQHDAAITNGNSGGPLFNEYGEVIGVNRGGFSSGQNLNIAVAAKELDNLSYGQPMTFAQVHKQIKDKAYGVVLNWLKQNGEYHSERYYDWWYSYDNDAYNFYYDEKRDEIVLRIIRQIGTSVEIDFYLSLNGDRIYSFWVWYYIGSNNEILAEGTLDASTYTKGTKLVLTEYEGNEHDKKSVISGASKAVELDIAVLDIFLQTVVGGLDITDFGFTAFEY